MEPNHLLAIGLGNVHKKIDTLNTNIKSDLSSSFGILDSSLSILSSTVNTNSASINTIKSNIGNIDQLSVGSTTNIISALNYLENSKLHIDLATELNKYNSHVLEFVDKDNGNSTSFSCHVYSKKYIDESMDSLYTDLNRCCVNMMGYECYGSNKSIIYGDNEFYYIDGSCSNALTYYYLNNDNEEQNITSYNIVFDPNTNTKIDDTYKDSYCIHIWYPSHINKPVYNNTLCTKTIYHPIKVKTQFGPKTLN